VYGGVLEVFLCEADEMSFCEIILGTPPEDIRCHERSEVMVPGMVESKVTNEGNGRAAWHHSCWNCATSNNFTWIAENYDELEIMIDGIQDYLRGR